MSRPRVLIMDDSAVFRRAIGKAVESDPDFEVAGIAATGRIALALIEDKNPDIIVMGMETPELDGMETLNQIKSRWPGKKVILFSARTQSGASATIDALTSGALDFVAKPSGNSLEENTRVIREKLVPKLRALAGPGGGSVESGGNGAPGPELFRQAEAVVPKITGVRQPVVAIGVSTGGPNALVSVLSSIPNSFHSPILIAQHMPPVFTEQLAARLNRVCPLEVSEARDGQLIKPDHVFIAPGDRHMEAVRHSGSKDAFIHIHQGPKVCNCRPSVDVLFRSVARWYGSDAIAVILTGMGRDGFEGGKALKDRDAYIIAQNQQTCVVYGMPSFFVTGGLADEVLPLEGIGPRLVQLTKIREMEANAET